MFLIVNVVWSCSSMCCVLFHYSVIHILNPLYPYSGRLNQFQIHIFCAHLLIITIYLNNLRFSLIFFLLLLSMSSRCICRESRWWWRWRPLRRSLGCRWWNSTGKWRGSSRTQFGSSNTAHDPGKHCFSSDHTGPTQPTLTGEKPTSWAMDDSSLLTVLMD